MPVNLAAVQRFLQGRKPWENAMQPMPISETSILPKNRVFIVYASVQLIRTGSDGGNHASVN